MKEADPKNARFIRLYTGIQARLYSYILGMVHNRSDAEELLQETSVVIWDCFDKYDSNYSFSAWAFGIAKNKIYEYLCENKETKKLFSDAVYEQLARAAEDSGDDILDRLETVKKCFSKLKKSDMTLMVYKYYSNKSINQISDLTGRSGNSLYKTFTRIIVQLRKCVGYQMRAGDYNV